MYKSGKFKLQEGVEAPQVNTLGLDENNLLFFNDGHTTRVNNSVSINPYIIDLEDPLKVLVRPSQFSVKQLYAIMNQKIQDGDRVRFICGNHGIPRLDAHGRITLVPYVNRDYKRTYLLDALEVF